MSEKEIMVYVSLGSNSADSLQKLAAARAALAAVPGLVLRAASPIYSTEPQGYADQPWFMNQILALAAAHTWQAPALLQEMLALERQLGRVRSADPALRFGPRAIDMDLLLFGEEESRAPGCLLPHPRMTERAFVLVPLCDIAPELCIRGRTARQWLAGLSYRLEPGAAASPEVRLIFQ